MSSLHIISEDTGASWQIWPAPDIIPAGEIREVRSYIFELRDSDRVQDIDLLIDGLPLEALRVRTPRTARWRWQTGFHAGEVAAELKTPGRTPIRFELTTDPDRKKLTRSDFDTMLSDILHDSFALFALTNFRKGIKQDISTKPPAIARLEYLRSRMDALECVIKEIERRPRRHLRSEERIIPYHQMRKATGNEVIRSFAGGRVARVPPNTRLPSTLRGFLPKDFRVQERFSSFDLPEHRQMAAVLASWASWLTASAEQLETVSKPRDPETSQSAALWANRCRRLAKRVHVMREAAPLKDLPHASPQLQLTSLFRSDPNYRKFYKLYQEFNLGLASVFGDFLNLPLARTFDLYELWCFLRLVHAGVREFGPAAVDFKNLFIGNSAGGLTIAASAVTVNVSSSWELMFQKRYEEFWKADDKRGSFSRTMTPDIVLAGPNSISPGPSKLIVLDAKYRIDTALNDAISSIHTYRDALVEDVGGSDFPGIVQAAYLLTPHIPDTSQSDYQETAMPGRLFHPDYRSTFRFGAATLKPGMPLAEICACLRAIIKDARSNAASP
ncbi:restriction endonuclease-like protein [Ruegeria sp. 2012CJ41-6]|uniref:Restriction endonuclease-like protein n=1 Tax=Ruegeria spongiae TaxID=2942209 RepID=A0ABT0Q5D7_9RHOB|nr:DUF2357 domain-containing protein [Ruegeria spongiae]MCL6284119.1 restriction endonuclease-like protein [Ruegeria spongiae]